MEINKFESNVTDDHVDLYLPISKVDKERRVVSGFATLDNIDKHGDIVTAEASRKAFDDFRGNIREMHMPKAVGKMINFKEKEYSGHNGIEVEVYVSKGAEDTWQKVIDGTLGGFSIGGNVKKKEDVPNPDGTTTWKIQEYDLMELSLVDSPANPLANVLSIKKVDDGYEFTGFATEESEELDVEKDFVEGSEELVGTAGTTININPPASTINEEGVVQKVVEAVKELFTQNNDGGNNMTTETDETAVDETETDVDDVEKAADVSEVEVEDDADNSVDVDDLIEKVTTAVIERLNKSVEAADEVTEDDTEVSTDDEEDPLTEAVSKLTDKIDELNSTTKDNNDRLEALEAASAGKKSTETGKTVTKSDDGGSFWAGSALGGTDNKA